MNHPPTPHLDFEALALWDAGNLPSDRVSAVRAHLDACGDCRDLLDQWRSNETFLASVTPLPSTPDSQFPEAVDQLVRPKLEQHFSSVPSGPGSRWFTPNPKPSAPEAPRVPNYILLRKLGSGSFGVVWEAEDIMGHPCAVKVLAQGDNQTAAYDLSGIQKAKQRRIPGLVHIQHVGRTDDFWYYVMDFVPRTLHSRMREAGPIPTEQAREITIGLLEGLSSCHRAGLVHRDIKPENIGFAPDGTLVLLDLGLVTEASRKHRTLVGTPDFMPHKPSADKPALDDLYAAGMILYCLLTGGEPVDEIPPPSQDQAAEPGPWRNLYEAARKAAAPLPGERFQSAEEFTRALVRNPAGARNNGQMAPAESGGPNNQKRTNTMKTDSMNTTQQLLTEAATVVGDIGLTQRQHTLQQEAEKLFRPKYRVAFIGQGKAGKSTLINRVLLKEPVLFIDTKEATAVPTEIEQGSPARLEVYPWTQVTKTVELDGQSVQVKIPTEGGAEVVEPTTANIQSRTSACAPDARAALANRTARVRLQWPAPALGGYTIVDTPGINTLTEAVMATTYRVIPEADAVIFVVRDETQLHQVEESFLRGKVFDQGVSRCLVVLKTHKPAAMRAHLVAAIRAQLDDMGREYVPVETVALPLPTESGGFAPLTAEETVSLAAFEKTLQDFLVQNVVPGRQERANSVLLREVSQARTECQVELATLQKSEPEKAELETRMTSAARDFQRSYRRLAKEFLGDLQKVQQVHSDAVCRSLTEIGEGYASGFDACKVAGDVIGAVKVRLSMADELMRTPFEEKLFAVNEASRIQIEALAAKYATALQDEAGEWVQIVAKEFNVDGGFVIKIPLLEEISLLIENIILNLMLPGGWILAALGQGFMRVLRFLRQLLPTTWIQNLIISQAKDGVMDAITEMKRSIRAELAVKFKDAETKLDENWEDAGQAQLDLILKPMREALKQSKNPARETELQQAITALGAIADRAN